jgi:gamma-glutamylcyclotransferase (GGCT)/AIG2-like uncharacterized protein YtfP
MIRVFTYGTLKPGEINHRVCAAHVVETQPAIAIGRLYHLPFDYPAMTLEEQGVVQGYVLTFSEPEILAALDDFEQHDPETFQQVAPGQSLTANQYSRLLLNVFTPDQIPLKPAWSYVMTRSQIQQLQGIPVPNGWWQGNGKGYKK